MRCEHVQERLLESQLRGETGIPQGLTPHLERCGRCRGEAAEIARGARAVAFVGAGTVEPPAHMKARVFERIAQERAREPWHAKIAALVRQPAFRWSAAAAVVLVAAAVGVVLAGSLTSHEKYESVAVVARADVDAMNGVDVLSLPAIAGEKRFDQALRRAQLVLEEVAVSNGAVEPIHAVAKTVRSTDLEKDLRDAAAAVNGPDRDLVQRIADDIGRIGDM
jgi:hypothetical protein